MYGEMKIPRLNLGVSVRRRYLIFVVRWPVGLIVIVSGGTLAFKTSTPKHSVCSERSLEYVSLENL